MKTRNLLISISIGLIVPMAAYAQSNSGAQRFLEGGRSDYRMGRMLAAEAAFRRAILADPSDPLPHYFLADLLARNNRHREAIAEYRLAMQGPASPVAEYCHQALMAYRVVPPDLPALPLGQKVRLPEGDNTPVARNNADSEAFDTIDRQARFEKNRATQFASRLGDSAIKGGDFKARDLKEVAESEVSYLYDQSRTVKGGMSSSNVAADAERIRRQAEERAKLEQQLAKERAAAHLAWANAREAELNETANNLKEQIQEKKSPYGFEMSAAGTGLYVRNYVSKTPKKRLPPAHFSVARFVDPAVEQQSNSESDK